MHLTSSSAPAIAMEAVSKFYRDGSSAVVAALADVSLQVSAGEMVALVGPSGSGKSTLLNLLAGLDTPSAGRVLVEGTDLASMSDADRSALRLRRIGIVFQAFNLLPGFTVFENVSWPLRFLGHRRRAARVRTERVLDECGLATALASRRPAELSGGEQQRVALARALVTRPHVLLADEPTGSLDGRNAEALLDLLETSRRTYGLTVVFATHDSTVVDRAGRTVVLAHGRLDAEGGSKAMDDHRIEEDRCATS